MFMEAGNLVPSLPLDLEGLKAAGLRNFRAPKKGEALLQFDKITALRFGEIAAHIVRGIFCDAASHSTGRGGWGTRIRT